MSTPDGPWRVFDAGREAESKMIEAESQAFLADKTGETTGEKRQAGPWPTSWHWL